MSQLTHALRLARIAAGLTQQELALQSGVSRNTVVRIENGSMDPQLSTFTVLARALGLDLMMMPRGLAEPVQQFVQSGGKMLAQPVGADAPRSIVAALLENDSEGHRT